jgi:hypothetical protein
MVQVKSKAYLDGYREINLDALKRRRPEKLKCKPGYKQRGAACQKIKPKRSLSSPDQGEASTLVPKKRMKTGTKVGLLLASATGLALAGGAIAIATDYHNLKIVDPKKVAPLVSEMKKEDIDKMYDDFQPGDMIRHSFPISKDKRVYHYGIYAGRNPATGEHEIIDAQRKEGKTGTPIIGKRSMMKDTGLGEGTSVFEKMPSEELSPDRLTDRDEIMARAEKLIGKKNRYNVIDNNCETFARAVVEGTPRSKDIETLSWVTRGIGKAIVAPIMDIVVNENNPLNFKNKDRGLTIKETRKQLEEASREYRESKRQRQDSLDTQNQESVFSLFYKDPSQDDYYIQNKQEEELTINDYCKIMEIASPEEAMLIIDDIVDTFPDNTQKYIRVSLLKDYLILLSHMTETVKELSSDEIKSDSYLTRSDRIPVKRPKKIKCKPGYAQRGAACQKVKLKTNEEVSSLQKQTSPKNSFSPFKQKLLLAISVAGIATLGKTVYDHQKYTKDITPDKPETLNLVSKDDSYIAYFNAKKSIGKGTSGEALLTEMENGEQKILKIPNLEQVPMSVFIYGAASEAICSDIAERAGIPMNKVQMIPADHVPLGKKGTRYGATLQEIAKGKSLEDYPEFQNTDIGKNPTHPSELIRGLRFEKMMVIENNIPKTLNDLAMLASQSSNKYNIDDLVDIYAFDTFVMNGDRHKGNLFYDDKANRFTGIDNGLAFMSPDIGQQALDSLSGFSGEKGRSLINNPETKKIVQRYRDKLHTLYTQNSASQIKNKFAGYMDTVNTSGIPAFLQELKMAKAVEKNNTNIESIITELDHILGRATMNRDSVTSNKIRADRKPIKRPKKLKCKPGYIQRGAACQKIKPKRGEEQNLRQGASPQFEVDERVTKKKGSNKFLVGALLATGVAGLAVAGTVGAIAVDIKKNVTPKDDEIPPMKDKFTKEQLDQVYDNLKPGDMVRRTFNQSNIIKAWHYGVYAGKNPDTGEHEIIHTNAKEGNVRIVRESLQNGAKGDSIYEPVPEKLINRGDKPKSREEIMARAESLIDKPYDFSFAYRNCEAIARGIVEGKINTRQPEKLSGFTKGVAKHVMDPLIRIALGKEKHMSNDEITNIMNESSKKFMASQVNQDSLFCYRFDELDKETTLNAGYGTSIANLFLKEPVVNPAVAKDIKSATVNDFTDILGIMRPQEANDAIEALVGQIEGSSKDEIKLNLFRDYLMAITSISKLKTEKIPTETEPKSDSYWMGFFQSTVFVT